MRRTAAQLLFSLLAGASLTVVVAWWLAASVSYAGGFIEWFAQDQSFTSGTWSIRRWEPPQDLPGCLPAPAHYPRAMRLVLEHQKGNDHLQSDHVAFDTLSLEAVRYVRSFQDFAERTGANNVESAMWDGRGWPMTAMACRWTWDYRIAGSAKAPLLLGGIGLAPDRATTLDLVKERALPLIPVWPGFAIDTLVYGSLFWALRFGARRWRQWRRWGADQCAHCGYPTGTSPVCTECGKPVKPRAAPVEAAPIAEPRN